MHKLIAAFYIQRSSFSIQLMEDYERTNVFDLVWITKSFLSVLCGSNIFFTKNSPKHVKALAPREFIEKKILGTLAKRGAAFAEAISVKETEGSLHDNNDSKIFTTVKIFR